MKAPKRNWRRYWHCYLLHLVQGIVVGILAWSVPMPALILFLGVMFYQAAEYIRLRELEGHGDTLKRDVMDIVFGIHIGILMGGTGQII